MTDVFGLIIIHTDEWNCYVYSISTEVMCSCWQQRSKVDICETRYMRNVERELYLIQNPGSSHFSRTRIITASLSERIVDVHCLQ